MKIGLITDIHEQVRCLERALLLADAAGCTEMACLGDITGYDPLFYAAGPGRNASGCIRMVRENCRWIVAGNHDRQARTDNPELSGEELDFLDSLQDFLIIEPAGRKVMLSHYIYPDLTGSSMEFVRRQSQLEPAHALFARENLSMALAGHDHPSGAGFGYPVQKRWNSRFRRAIHYMPFGRYHLDGDPVICLLPALATVNARPGMTVWDPESGLMDIIQLDHS